MHLCNSAALPVGYELGLGAGFALSRTSQKQVVAKMSGLFSCRSIRNVLRNQPTDLHGTTCTHRVGAALSITGWQLLQKAFALLLKQKLGTETSVLKAQLSIHPGSWVQRDKWRGDAFRPCSQCS